MSKSILFFFILFSITFFSAYSQSKKVVAVMPFLSSTPENKQSAAALQSLALQVFNAKSNITVVDRSADEQVVKELNNQIREESISSKVLVEQGKLSGSQEIIVGTLNSVSVVQKGDKYVASLNYTLQVDDAATGTLISSKNFRGNTNNQDIGNKILGLGGNTLLSKSSSLLMADTKEAAINNAINDSRKQMVDWINEVYPPEIKILAVDTRNSKGLPETVTIGGFETNVSSGKTIIVNEITYLDDGSGKKLKKVKKIAELKVTEVQGEVTECKVKDGPDELDEKMKSGAKLEFVVK